MEDTFDVSHWSDLFPPRCLSPITGAVKSCMGELVRGAICFILIAMVGLLQGCETVRTPPGIPPSGTVQAQRIDHVIILRSTASNKRRCSPISNDSPAREPAAYMICSACAQAAMASS